MAGEISKPHDHLFRSVFGEEREAEAASLLQAYLPEAISRELRWSSLRWQSVSFVDDRLRGSESDLLYAIERAGDGATGVAVRAAGAPDATRGTSCRLRGVCYDVVRARGEP